MKEKFDDLSLAEMIAKRKELLESQRKLRFDKVLGHVESPMELRTNRRSIARLHTKIYQQTKAQEQMQKQGAQS